MPHFSVDRNALSLMVTARRLDAVHGRVFGLSPLTVVLSCLFVLFRFFCTTDTVDRQRKHTHLRFDALTHVRVFAAGE